MSGCVVWITGLPAAGKSTLAWRVNERLRAHGIAACVVDGDAVRKALVPPPGYSPGERDDFYATLANLAVLLASQGLVVLVPATANRRAYRERARDSAHRFLEVHVAATREDCEARDVKGLYRRDLADLPGAGVPYEPPAQPDVIAQGGHDDPAVERIVNKIGAL